MSDQDQQERWYSMEARKLLAKERYFTSSHNYFFEVKETNAGSKYIVIDQRKKVGNKFVSNKVRIFEDEMLEFERVLHKMIHYALYSMPIPQPPPILQDTVTTNSSDSELAPAFFSTLSSTSNWREFETHVYYLLKLLGIQTVHSFLGERQAGRADGFLRLNNLAVIYDCTLDNTSFEANKGEQINNYCNRLKQGSIEVSNQVTEEFYHHHKQVWIITQGRTRLLRIINDIEVKEVSVQDIMGLYQERLTTTMSDQSLEMKLRNL